MQLYYLHHHNTANAARLYRLSRSGRQEFPLSIVSMNITKWTLQVCLCGYQINAVIGTALCKYRRTITLIVLNIGFPLLAARQIGN